MPMNRKTTEPKKRQTRFDKIEPDWTAILKVTNKEFIVKTGKAEDERRQELQVAINIYPGVGLSLTAFTAKELAYVRATFELAFDLAQASCEEADRLAQEAYEDGGDDFRRLYRQDPIFAVRKRVLAEHNTCLPSGLEGVADLDRGKRPEPDHVGGA